MIAFGNREKIVVGSIATIFLIAALHLFIFSGKARSYSDAKNERNQAKDRYQQLRNIPKERLDKYIEETQSYEKVFNNTIQQFKRRYNVFTSDKILKTWKIKS